MEERRQDKAEQQYVKMTQTPIPKLVTTLGIPTTISMLVTNIYNMADTYFVGQIGTSASGAIGVVFGLMAIIQAFGFMFGHGAGSILSRKLGKRDVESAFRFASTSFFCGLAAGALITVFGLLFLNPLMRLLGSTDTILPYARTYGRFILIAAPLMCSSCVMNNVLRYEGQASLSMIGLGTGSLLNIFGDWLLVRVLDLGITGAGISTAVSQTVSFLILLFMMLSGRTQSRLALRNVTGKWGDFALIVKTGFPSLMRQGLSSISTMVLNNQAALYGDAAVAAMSIVNRVCQFMFSVALGIGQGFQPVSSFNYGAGKYSRVRKAFLFTFAVGEGLLGIFSIIAMQIPGVIVSFFRDDAEVIAVGTAALRCQLIALFFQPLSICGNMLFQSIGKNGRATFMSMLRSGLYFIPIVLILPHFFGLTGVEISQSVSDILACLTTIPFVLYFLGKLPPDEAF